MTEEVREQTCQSLRPRGRLLADNSDIYRDADKDEPGQIADELGVRYLLTATVRWQRANSGPSRIRFSPELVDVQPGQTPVAMWHDTFDATLADVFEVQADIANQGRRASLGVALGAEDRKSPRSTADRQPRGL